MRFPKPSSDFVYHYEILRARNEIRDHFSKTFIKDIYENSGQLLSLIRIKLAIAKNEQARDQDTEITASGEMLALVVKNLKQISKLLFPENEILSESGFINALRQELQVDEKDNSQKKLMVKGVPCELPSGTGLILFQLIIEIIGLIKEEFGEEGLSLEINYTRKKMKIFIRFQGYMDSFIPPLTGNNVYADPLTIEERLGLIDATMEVKKLKGGREALQLVVNI